MRIDVHKSYKEREVEVRLTGDSQNVTKLDLKPLQDNTGYLIQEVVHLLTQLREGG